MVSVKHDKDGKIVAYVEYFIVDKDGQVRNDGEYCFVRECWLHPSVERNGVLKDFVMTEHMRWPSVKWLYYQRRKYNGKLRKFDIERFYRKEN